MAMITSSGGSVVRDLLVTEIPAVLKSDFYATAALIGGKCFVLLGLFSVSTDTRLGCTITITVCLRALAMKYGMHLPKAKRLPASPSQLAQQRKDRAAR